MVLYLKHVYHAPLNNPDMLHVMHVLKERMHASLFDRNISFKKVLQNIVSNVTTKVFLD